MTLDGKLAIIGGSGINDSPEFQDAEWQIFETLHSNGFGNGRVEYQEFDGVIFIPRHGRHETVRHSPSTTQYGANLIAARMLGATTVVAFSCVGSLTPFMPVKEIVIPVDYIDESRRDDNLFGVGLVVHANPNPPFSEGLKKILFTQAAQCFPSVSTGVYVTIPGDRFGTAAEGTKRAQYAHIVGMTLCPEASMAMQLGLHYACAAFVVDMNTDANHEGETVRIMHEMGPVVQRYVHELVPPAKEFARDPPKLVQLVGNIIPGKMERVPGYCPALRQIAEELVQKYCA
ncbi:MAG: MTAP family purine nucleoside phosphorylase [Candidatus Woesearchaeota archaeon]|nr:MTAP family purine nucleoside phosphorylase [Candidatus Woesearchaeota archaeon]